MSTPKDWRIAEGLDDWMRGQEKRVAHEERRPRIARAQDLMGPTLAPTAVEVSDWSGPETMFNGLIYSKPGALHAPDSSNWWMGTTIAQADGYGVQEAYDFRGASSPVPLYTRRFSMVGGTRVFSPWTLSGGGGGGGGSVTSVAGRTGAIILTAADIASGTFSLSLIPTGTTASTVALGNHTHTLDNLSDVTVTSPATGNVIRWSGTEWVNAVLSQNDVSGLVTALAGKAPTSHTHTKSQITDFAHTHTKSEITDFAHTHAIADLPVAASGTSSTTQVVRADDTRLSDARTPTAHTHTKSQITDLGTIGTAAAKNIPATGNAATTEVVMGNDTRLTDARTPTTHTHTKSQITDFAHTHPNTDITGLGTASTKNVPATGNAATTEVVLGTDTRLTDARTPTTHTHTKSQITDFAHTHPVTDLTATGTRDATTFLRGDNTWAVPSGGGGGGVIICTSSTRPASPSAGTQIWETDTKTNWLWDGSAWNLITKGSVGYTSINTNNTVTNGTEVVRLVQGFTARTNIRYRITGYCVPQTATAGFYTLMRLYWDTVGGTTVGTTMLKTGIKDHRIAARSEALGFDGEFVYTGTDMATIYAKMTLYAGGANVTDASASYGPTTLSIQTL